MCCVAGVIRFLDDYMVQISNMVRFNKSTVYVNFQHLQEVGGVDRSISLPMRR